jgi:hypothetical protein
MSASTVFTAARDSLALSIYPVPVRPGAKDINIKNWPDLRIELDDLEKHFGNGENIGWLLGIKPRPIADVDLDCPEALAIAPFIKGPKTDRISGHKSNPASHYFFELPGEFEQTTFPDPFRKGKDDRKMIVELRGKGNQTVVPPSIHDTGEPYEWYKKGEFGKATHHDVLRWTAKIAAAALLVRYWQARVSGRLALIGMLARAEWPEEETLEFVSAVIRLADPDDLKDVKANVTNCYHRVEGDGEAFGQPTLKEVLGDKGKIIVKTIADWLGLNRATQQGMILSEKGNPLAILANAITALRASPEWKDVLGFNEFSLFVVTRMETPWGKPPGENWTDTDTIRATEWLQHKGILVSPQVAENAVQAVAEENRFHPVREYFETLKWDGTERIGAWLTTYLGAPATKFTEAVGSRWLISAVARILSPGCKADYTLLLEGPQGIKKSTALQTLAGSDWFIDHISSLDSKDARLELHGVWIVELAELSSMKGLLSEKVKSFLTGTSDNFRPPYGRRVVHVPRTNVFSGSTNITQSLSDETGGRRYWPVECGVIDIEGLSRNRDQLWAEALGRYKNGTVWWFESDELNKLASEEQDKRYEGGHWDAVIEKWLEDPQQKKELIDGISRYVLPWDSDVNEVTIDDILLHAVGKPVERWDQRDKIAVAKCLTHNNWRRVSVRDGKKVRKAYRRPVDSSG